MMRKTPTKQAESRQHGTPSRPSERVQRSGPDDGGRVTWFQGDERPGPRQVIGVLELSSDRPCRVVMAERTQVDGRCHVLLARQAWGGKDTLDTRWWSLVLDKNLKVNTIRNGSCGDRILTEDVPRIVCALKELDLLTTDTMIAVDDGPPAFPCLPSKDHP
jgi:hypothetical protein